MKVLLIGNGVDIQYGGSDYVCSSIVNRAIQNVKSGNFCEVDYPASIVEHLHTLYDLSQRILQDRTFIDNKAWTNEDKIALDSFCFRYSSNFPTQISDVGFEDYFLIQRLYFNFTYDSKVGNYQERNDYYEFLRRFFLDAVYNTGKICDIKYPEKMSDFLNQFDNLFSLNYDRNIEKVTNKKIHYLHGAFHIISEKYNNSSPMNKVMGIHTDVDGREHLYSTALTTYCGKEKEDLLTQANNVNEFLKLSPKFKKEYEKTGTEITPQLKAIILAKELCPDYVYPQNYCYDIFKKIEGEITILGMSPLNDDHIVRIINNNINKIIYYFYPCKNCENEKEQVKAIFSGKPIEFKNVKKFWSSIEN